MKKIFLVFTLLTIMTSSASSQSEWWCETKCWQWVSDCISYSQDAYAHCALSCAFDYLGDWINHGDWEAQLNYEYCINYCYFDQLWTEFYCHRDYEACIRDCEG